MKAMKTICVLNLVIFLIVLSGGCRSVSEINGLDEGADSISMTEVTFNLCGVTKSSISPDTRYINDINIAAYLDGKLMEKSYAVSPQTVKMLLLNKGEYDFYALANQGEKDFPSDESEIEDMMECRIAGIDDLDGPIPMSWKLEDYDISASSHTLNLELQKLVSKLSLTIDKSSLTGMEVTSVRLCQSALSVFPFKDKSCVTSSYDVADGDYATQTDLSTLNNGGTIVMYAMENCQGVLLPDNTDPWKKVPSYIDGKEDICTYLEVSAILDGTGELSGKVTYRLYLGQDNVSDFSVIRNNDINISLMLTKEGLMQIGWKVQSDVTAGDVLFNYDRPEYVGEYGRIFFEEATADDPVSLYFNGKEIIVGDGKFKTADYQDVLFFYCFPDDPCAVYVLWRDKVHDVLPLTLKQGLKVTSLELQDVLYPNYMLEVDGNRYFARSGGPDVVMGEDGELKSFLLYLSDERGNVLERSRFYYPEVVAEYFGFEVYDNCENFFLDDYNFNYSHCCDNGGHYALRSHSYLWGDDTDALCIMKLYGMLATEEGKSTEIILSNGKYSDEVMSVVIPAIVTPVFQNQGWIGEYYNYSLAPGSLADNKLSLELTGKSLGESVSWGFRAAGFQKSDDPELVWNDKSYPEETLGITCSMADDGTLELVFLEPDYPNTYRPACGGIVIEGTFNHPITGKSIKGYYMMDIVLYLSVGVQVDFCKVDTTTDIHYGFSPFTEYSRYRYSDMWESFFPDIQVQSVATDGSQNSVVCSYVCVPVAYSGLPLTINVEGGYFNNAGYSTLINVLAGLEDEYFTFDFYAGGKTYSSMTLTRDRCSDYGLGEMSDGSNGFYQLMRQYDILNFDTSSDNGLKNYVIESAYNSFRIY